MKLKAAIVICILALLTGLALHSCSSKSKEEIAIKKFVETIGNTTTDLSFKVIDMSEVGIIKCSDSIEIYKKELSLKTDIKVFYDTLVKRISEREKAVSENSGKVLGYHMQKYMDETAEILPKMRKVQSDLNKYLSSPERTLYKKIKCHYSAINPFMGNAKQEITRIFYFNPETEKVIGAED